MLGSSSSALSIVFIIFTVLWLHEKYQTIDETCVSSCRRQWNMRRQWWWMNASPEWITVNHPPLKILKIYVVNVNVKCSQIWRTTVELLLVLQSSARCSMSRCQFMSMSMKVPSRRLIITSPYSTVGNSARLSVLQVEMPKMHIALRANNFVRWWTMTTSNRSTTERMTSQVSIHYSL